MASTVNPPSWFYVVSAIAFIWNLMGVAAYLAQALVTPEVLAAMPEAERTLIENTPAYVTAAFALAVWGGALGTLFLLIRKSWAVVTLLVSLVGIVVQLFWNLFIGKTLEVYGPGQAIMPVMVFIIGFLLLGLAKKASAKQWIN